ncbi:hypothetical protein AMTR_s00006p00252380 [Amborella trichopoda]|uniref:Uncharacterized protein n=1 Tax=Amborella trichopoda TaxID=13333 RepID=W1PCU2_AMBTC|nr:hypothetical protein AMTR_s00006p00252380 [Amborella trichopoda]
MALKSSRWRSKTPIREDRSCCLGCNVLSGRMEMSLGLEERVCGGRGERVGDGRMEWWVEEEGAQGGGEG